MRGIYTAGVLDYFLEKGLHFPYVVGVSAGACNAASYISRQLGRNKIVNSEFVDDPRFLSLRNLVKEGSLWGMDFVFREVPMNLVPFDFEAYRQSNTRFFIGATDCNTGGAVYFDKKDDLLMALKASSSLPLISPVINYKGYKLLDGGISDSIPVKKSMEDGNNKQVVVLTRNRGYRKEAPKSSLAVKLKYKANPGLCSAILNRYRVYNETLDLLESLERNGKVFIISPTEPLEVGRFEKKKSRLIALYEKGIQDAGNIYDSLMRFIWTE